MKKIILTALTLGILSISGCASNPYSSATYGSSEVKQAQEVQYGVVQAVRTVDISKESGAINVGSVSGAVIGGLAGNTIGGGSGKLLTTAGGALLGGLAGNSVNNAVGKKVGMEIDVKLDNSGKIISVVQANDIAFSKGQKVRVVGNGNSVRVTH